MVDHFFILHYCSVLKKLVYLVTKVIGHLVWLQWQVEQIFIIINETIVLVSCAM